MKKTHICAIFVTQFRFSPMREEYFEFDSAKQRKCSSNLSGFRPVIILHGATRDGPLLKDRRKV